MTGEPETVSCGQNNQGYGIITVDPKAAPAATGTLASTPPGLTTSPGTVPPTFPGTTQVRLDGSGLAFGTQVLLERGDSGRRRSSWAIKSPGWCMPTHRRTSPTIILSSSMTARRPRGGSSRPPPCTGRAQTAAASLGSPGDHRPLASTPFTRSSWAAIRPSTTSRRCGQRVDRGSPSGRHHLGHRLAAVDPGGALPGDRRWTGPAPWTRSAPAHSCSRLLTGRVCSQGRPGAILSGLPGAPTVWQARRAAKIRS